MALSLDGIQLSNVFVLIVKDLLERWQKEEKCQIKCLLKLLKKLKLNKFLMIFAKNVKAIA